MKKTRVNVIGFVRKDESQDELLKQMAKENGGLFKHITKADLEKK